MNDFCIRLENMPNQNFYNNDENILRMKLWKKIYEIIEF